MCRVGKLVEMIAFGCLEYPIPPPPPPPPRGLQSTQFHPHPIISRYDCFSTTKKRNKILQQIPSGHMLPFFNKYPPVICYRSSTNTLRSSVTVLQQIHSGHMLPFFNKYTPVICYRSSTNTLRSFVTVL